MAVEQLPADVREFVGYLDGLLARLEQRSGWCAVFWQRDPDGMRACLDGAEIPPWDVVEALLQDLAAGQGARADRSETDRARTLHAASLVAYDAVPGGRQALADRLDVMLREQRYASGRQQDLTRLRAAARTGGEAQRLDLELAWARDDHERASARCVELRARIAERDRGTADGGGGVVRDEGGASPGPVSVVPPGARPEPGPRAMGTKKAARRPRGARFAGLEEGPELSEAVRAPAPQTLPEPPPTGNTPRGARFAGARAPAEEAPAPQPPDPDARRATGEAVAVLGRLRREGRSGEAHAVLVEAVHWPPGRWPLLAAELRRAGLAADWATLLWEAASLPPDRLVEAADALVAAGRSRDGSTLLRQGVARPATEIADALHRLTGDGRGREARALADAYLAVRTPEEAAEVARRDPGLLAPLLLAAAAALSRERHRDLVHAMRVAGVPA